MIPAWPTFSKVGGGNVRRATGHSLRRGLSREKAVAARPELQGAWLLKAARAWHGEAQGRAIACDKKGRKKAEIKS